VELRIYRITFQAAHYIPGHPTCGVIHGHTYQVRDIKIKGRVRRGMVLDFGKLKQYFKDVWDHSFIVPFDDAVKWRTLLPDMGLSSNIVCVKIPTVECIAQRIKEELKELFPKVKITFELWETDNEGVKIGR